MITRRSLLFAPLIPMIFNTASFCAPVAPLRLSLIHIVDNASGISFALDINDNQHLRGTFEAPTNGWLAVGLNTTTQLAQTRFLMAARDGSDLVQTQERIADPPHHRHIDQFGAQPIFKIHALEVFGKTSRLQFMANREIAAPHPLNLSPGRQIGLMLAWSHETDFDHHSAWRRHFAITV